MQVERGLEPELWKLLTGCKQKCCLRNMGCAEGHAGSARGLVVSHGFEDFCSGWLCLRQRELVPRTSKQQWLSKPWAFCEQFLPLLQPKSWDLIAHYVNDTAKPTRVR